MTVEAQSLSSKIMCKASKLGKHCFMKPRNRDKAQIRNKKICYERIDKAEKYMEDGIVSRITYDSSLIYLLPLSQNIDE